MTMASASTPGRFSYVAIPCVALAALLLLAQDTAVAHTGSMSFSRPLSGIVVDGDLSDWPEGLVRYPINTPAGWAEEPTDSADHEAWFRIGRGERDLCGC